jgi:hypothetical protein
MRLNSCVECGQEIVALVYAHVKGLSLSLEQKECNWTAPELWLVHRHDKQSKLRFTKHQQKLNCHLLFSAVSGQAHLSGLIFCLAPVYDFMSTL